MSETGISKRVRIDRRYPNDLQSYFVSNIVVQHEPDRFILTFFEIWPPPIIGETDEEMQHILESLDSVEAKCVARIVLSPNKMEEFLRVANENFSKFESKMKNQSY
jgi:hypothetical protein